MSVLGQSRPSTILEPVTDVLHGVPVTDPFRWLENQDSPRTRRWLTEQTLYARGYLDNIPGRERIRERIRELLDVEAYEALLECNGCYYFRKRLPRQQQACIYMREGVDGSDQMLLDPAARGTGKHTAVIPLFVSRDGRLLLYEVKQGGERSGTFEIFDSRKREVLPDILPRGYLFGFAFAPDAKSFYYVHEPLDAAKCNYKTVYCHLLGSQFSEDREIFRAEGEEVFLPLIADGTRLGLIVCRLVDTRTTDFYVAAFGSDVPPRAVVERVSYEFRPLFVPDGLLAVTNRNAPNFRVVEISVKENSEPEWIEIVQETGARISDCRVACNHIFVSYVSETTTHIRVFDFSGRQIDEISLGRQETLRLIGNPRYSGQIMFEQESFTQPTGIFRYSPGTSRPLLWARRSVPFDSGKYGYSQASYTSKDQTRIPIFLVGRKDILASHDPRPVIMTSYGGFGVSMTPQFSIFVAFLMEKGCLFALPSIRGGAEFGAEWHNAGKRHKRQNTYDDFLSAAEWLIRTGRTTPDKLAIFGGSNSGLLVGAALTQRPELFRAVICMVPLLDMLRYHLFDIAKVWQEEYGCAENREDFAALLNYSPYHNIRQDTAYPATLFVSGDSD